MKNTSLTAEEAQQMLTSWQESGLSQKEFCARENISFHRFYYWKKKLSGKIKMPSEKFIKLPAPPFDTDPGIFAEVILPNNCRVILHKEVSLKDLRTLIR